MGRPGVDGSPADGSASEDVLAPRGTKVQMRKRRQRVTWFPNTGTHPSEASAVSGIAFALNYTDAPTNLTGVLPLTFDYPQEGSDLDPTVDSLSEIVGSEYILKRVVGKMFVHLETSLEDQATEAILFGAGLFVARADSINGPNGANSPIGTPAQIDSNYGPLAVDTVREPWIWRRTWILGNSSAIVHQTTGGIVPGTAALFPPTTAGYGSVADGPHVDAKVQRRVSQDDRLWLAVSARKYPLSAVDPQFAVNVRGYFDYRILGSLRKAKNSSAF